MAPGVWVQRREPWGPRDMGSGRWRKRSRGPSALRAALPASPKPADIRGAGWVTVPLGLGCSAQLGERLKYCGDCSLLQPVVPTDSHQFKAVLLEVFGAEVDVLGCWVPQALAAGVQPLAVGQPQASPRVVLLGKPFRRQRARALTCGRRCRGCASLACPACSSRRRSSDAASGEEARTRLRNPLRPSGSSEAGVSQRAAF